MNRFALLLAGFGVVMLATTSEAAPRIFGGGYGNGYNGGTGIGIGYGNGYYGNGFNNGYYGNGYNNGYYGNRGYGYNPYNGGYSNGVLNNGYSSNYGGNYQGTYYGVPSNWYSSSPWTTRGNTVVTTPNTIAPATFNDTTAVSAGHWGLRVDEVMNDGAAKKADLRKGDVIIGVNKTRTESLEDLQQALAGNRGQVEMTFMNSENQKIERVRITPADGKIGVAVTPISLPQ